MFAADFCADFSEKSWSAADSAKTNALLSDTRTKRSATASRRRPALGAQRVFHAVDNDRA